MHRGHRILLAAVIVAALASRVAVAAVDPAVAEARQHVQKGMALYDEGKYEDAAREMEDAYRIKSVPELQYNLAQCYERLGKLGDAAIAYRRYSTGKPDAEDADAVRERIKNLDERIAREKAGGPVAPPPPVEKLVLKTVIVYKEAPPQPGRFARYVGWGLAAVALAAVGGGVAFAVLARRDADTVTTGGNPKDPLPFSGASAMAQAEGQQYSTLSIVGFSIAGVAALGSAGLFLLGGKIDRESTAAQRDAVSVLPSLSRGGAGLVVAGSF